MAVRIARLSDGVGRRHPVTIRKASLVGGGLWGGCERCGTRQERSTLQLNAPGLKWLFAMLLLQHPNRSQQVVSRVWHVMSAFCKVTQGVGDTWTTCPTLLRGIWSGSRNAGFRCWDWQWSNVILNKIEYWCHWKSFFNFKSRIAFDKTLRERLQAVSRVLLERLFVGKRLSTNV